MDSKMIRQILDFNRKAFDDSFKAIVAVQEHTEKMMRVFWEKSTFIPVESQQVVGDWVDAYKNGLDELKTNVDNRFKLIEDYLLNVAGQMESSLKTSAPQTDPVENVHQATKEVAIDLQKNASRSQTVKKIQAPIKKK
jgi:hypothetical protein